MMVNFYSFICRWQSDGPRFDTEAIGSAKERDEGAEVGESSRGSLKAKVLSVKSSKRNDGDENEEDSLKQ